MSVVGTSATGLPRPVGSEFRQRQVYAKDPSMDHAVPWVVSVVDTLGGPLVEIRKAHAFASIVAIELDKHGTSYNEMLTEVKRLLSVEEGWERKVVKECRVAGCSNPQPMWHEGWRNNTGECLACETRTVLACTYCGAPDVARTAEREWMLANSVCFICKCWLANEQKYGGKPEQVITSDYRHCVIVPSTGGPAAHKGFGGRKWEITFTDGRVVETDNLWSQGEIPPWMRDRFTPNASVQAVLTRASGAVVR